MSKPPPLPEAPARRLRTAALGVAVGLGLLVIYSCSVIVETRDTQCQSDSDCTSFAADAHCDPTSRVCVGPSSGSSSSGSSSGGCSVDGGIDGGGCYACTPVDDSQLLNACTTGCVAFDNKRVTLLPADGKLPSLPNPGPDGGF